MAAGLEHINLDESTLLTNSDFNSYSYIKTKAQADKIILKANKPIFKQNQSGLLTTCIRLSIIYEEVSLTNIILKY